MGLGSDRLDINALFSREEVRAIQFTAIALSAVSCITCLLSLYWFTVMRRNFRRTLILLLLISDLFKSLWYLVFPIVSLAKDGIRSYSAFCDVGGFFLQAGVESCDIAILMMSMHMAIQIFHSTSPWFGPDGLYRVRYGVYAIWILLPCFMAALAFVRAQGAYLSQGAFCTLPIRPFWYRLALSWIPRYLIVGYVTWVAFRIYMKVGSGFKVFARQVDSRSNPTDSMPSTRDPQTAPEAVSTIELAVAESGPTPLFNSRSPFDTKESKNKDVEVKVSDPFSSEGSSSASSSRNPSSGDATQGSSGLVRIVSAEAAATRSRRAAIQRQTRLLFIYPCAYMILMIMPFVQHCFNYSDYYAQHPIFPVSLLSTICYSIMGAVDALIFCWREKPWRSIPGRDGTLHGSLFFSVRNNNNNKRPSRPGSTSSLTAVRRSGQRLLFRGMKSDRSALAAEYAAERLALERQAAAQHASAVTPGTAERKEWFDRKQSFMEEGGASAAASPMVGGPSAPEPLGDLAEEGEHEDEHEMAGQHGEV